MQISIICTWHLTGSEIVALFRQPVYDLQFALQVSNSHDKFLIVCLDGLKIAFLNIYNVLLSIIFSYTFLIVN